MGIIVKDIRIKTGMTQKAFSERFGIPISTLRKWEQGESSPPQYVIDLIAASLPAEDSSLRKIPGRNGTVYYYDRMRHRISDMRGNEIRVAEDLLKVKERNLALYLTELFEAFYEIQEKFDRDCRFDQQEDILWI